MLVIILKFLQSGLRGKVTSLAVLVQWPMDLLSSKLKWSPQRPFRHIFKTRLCSGSYSSPHLISTLHFFQTTSSTGREVYQHRNVLGNAIKGSFFRISPRPPRTFQSLWEYKNPKSCSKTGHLPWVCSNLFLIILVQLLIAALFSLWFQSLFLQSTWLELTPRQINSKNSLWFL